jgi:hypothetical protein
MSVCAPLGNLSNSLRAAFIQLTGRWVTIGATPLLSFLTTKSILLVQRDVNSMRLPLVLKK